MAAPGSGCLKRHFLVFSSFGIVGSGRHLTKTSAGVRPRHATALVGPLGIVVDEEGVEVLLHGIDALVELLPSHDPEVLVEQGPVQALYEAVGLRPPHLGRAVLDLLELQEQLIRVAIGPATELAAVMSLSTVLILA